MVPHSPNGAYSDSDSPILWEDGERVFRRGWWLGDNGQRREVLIVRPANDHTSRSSLDHLTHEYELKDELDGAWAVRPLHLVRGAGRTMLVLEDADGEPLDRLLGAPMEMGRFLDLAIAIAAAVGKLHQRSLVHKDIKPANILVNAATGEVRLTGFGIASRLARERQSPQPPEMIAGTLAYMAPEQTGRMNRSIDSRSDLYALGVTFYQMLTGALPFVASDPMEWVHCHLARRPVAPAERLREIPGAISAIVMKMLAKRAEDRYQTAAGLESDLRRCRSRWQAQRRIDEFPLGEHDTPDQLLIPEKLYGRRREIDTLLASFDRVVNGGAPELILVSGYSGIGKSSVVNELQPVLVPPRGLFASGKFDQYKRDIPYSTLAQAFQSLVRPLLGKSEADLAPWREALRETLGPNAGLIVNLVPEVKLIIGEPPPVPELPPQDMQRRFQLVLRQFIGIFARPDHPLALFLDDLQWLDAATLELLEDLLCRSDLSNLLLIGAYRDNEVTAAHPLMRKLEAFWATGRVRDIKLGPLTANDLGGLVADSLRCGAEQAASLAQLVHLKTNGNPFFVIQFLQVLAEAGLIAFDHDRARWSWDLAGIHAKQYTDNVVELLTPKLKRLQLDTQNALRQLACLGNVADVATLSMVLETPEERVHATLLEAQRQQLIDRRDSTYKFVHDRVQEAAYALIPKRSRAKAHLTIGRLLTAHIPPEKRDEAIFDIVNQFDRAAALLTEEAEREQVAALNFIAGKRAKAASAFTAALRYFAAGRSLLGENVRERRSKLAFDLELHLAECEYLVGQLAEAEQRLTALSEQAQNPADSAAVVYLRLNLYMVMDRSDDAIAVGFAYLYQHQAQWSLHPTAEDVMQECSRLWQRLEDSSIEALVDLPLMTDPEQQATMNVLSALIGAAQFTNLNLFHLIIVRMVAISLEYGNTEGSCLAYAVFGSVPSHYPDQAHAGFRVGRIALDLVEKHGFDRSRGKAYYGFALFTAHWTQPLASCQRLLQRAFEAAQAVGDLTIASFARVDLVTNLLARGASLEEVEREAKSALAFVQSVRFGLIGDVIATQLRLIRMLRGQTPDLNSFDDGEFHESAFEQHLEGDPRLAVAASRYWIRKLQAKVYSGDFAAAVEAVSKAASLLWTLPAQQELPEYHFYAALAWAGYCDSTAAEERDHALQELRVHHERIARWSRTGPENFAHKAAVLGGELARLEGREQDAIRLYEEAVRSAREQGFVHNEGLANELAARFWAARGLETIAHAYLRNARYSYLRWGADGKVRQLDRLYPDLRHEQPMPDPMSTITAPVEHLDLATVIEVSQSLSGEMVLGNLIERLMRSAIEYAGAERGLLISPQREDLQIDAEASAQGEGIEVQVGGHRVLPSVASPESLIRYAIRTRETVILDDALARNPFSADTYIVKGRARSILCLPLVNQGKLIGILYLENTLMAHVFTPDRVTVLKVLASQAAISLENTRLYREIAESERSLRSAIDGIPGLVGVLASSGDIEAVNRQILEYTGQTLEELKNWGTNGTVHPEDRPHVVEVFTRSIAAGMPYQIEQRLRRSDGEYRWFDNRGIPIRDDSGRIARWYVLLTDIEDRTQALARLQQMQADFAHMNRVSVMGELAATLSHEILHPIATARNNARAGMRFLEMKPPDLGEVREALSCVVRDADRARDIVARMRDHVRKAPPRREPFDLNEAVGEVIVMVRSAITRNRIAVSAELTDGKVPVQGDRVQLQQVVINLILNAVEAMSSLEEGARELSIRIEQGQADGVVLFQVRNSGPGIDPAGVERIFEPFYTTKVTGVGMGLSICRSIINNHGGQLWAEANEPRGAVFQFTLPPAQESS